MSATSDRPAHLDPSELGTKEYWDTYYQNDLANGREDEEEEEQLGDPSNLESWFDDVDAPAKVLEFLTSEDFPLAPSQVGDRQPCSVLDLGTGNGSMLFSLRLEGEFVGHMTGVDYSQQSIDLATRLWKQYSQQSTEHEQSPIEFYRTDLIRDDPRSQPWWSGRGFDLVLDKGTFDAISLSSETIDDGPHGHVRLCELYPRKVIELIAPGGYLLITSCNWTEEEVIRWFTQGDGMTGQLQLFGKIHYPVYEFGGQKGQGVASVCFQRTKLG